MYTIILDSATGSGRGKNVNSLAMKGDVVAEQGAGNDPH